MKETIYRLRYFILSGDLQEQRNIKIDYLIDDMTSKEYIPIPNLGSKIILDDKDYVLNDVKYSYSTESDMLIYTTVLILSLTNYKYDESELYDDFFDAFL